jgi:hypothetical protein
LSIGIINIDNAIGCIETRGVAVIPCCDRTLVSNVVSPIVEFGVETFWKIQGTKELNDNIVL